MKLENSLSIPVPTEEAWRVLLDIERVAPCVPGATLTSQDGDSYHGKIKVKLGPIGLTYNGTVAFLSQDEEAKVAVLEATGRETRGGGTAKALVTCRLVGSGGSTEVLVETDLAITGKPAQFGRGALAEVAGSLIGQFATNLAAEIGAAPGGDGAAPGGDSAAPGVVGAGSKVESATPGVNGAASALDKLDGGVEPARAATSAASPAVPVTAPAAPAVGGGGALGTTARPAPAVCRPASEPIDLLDVAGGGVVKRIGPAVAGTSLLLLVFMLGRHFGRRAARRAASSSVD